MRGWAAHRPITIGLGFALLARVLISLILATSLAQVQGHADAATLDTHPVAVDSSGKLVSWVTPQDKAYDRVMYLSWDLLLNKIPIDPANGLKVFYTHCDYDAVTLNGYPAPNNAGSKNAMLADAAAMYYAYSGDRAVIDLVRGLLDHHLAHGMTPANYDWAKVPWSTGAPSSITYGNDAHIEGVGVLEPDKIGELGYHGFLRFYELTGDTLYRNAAIDCANALVAHVRVGNATQSPWPFRVHAQTGALGGEDYCADVIAPIRLFDELIRLGLGNVAGYQAARQTAWTWLMAYPMVNNVWTSYFEDIPSQGDLHNMNQYDPGQTARYLLEHPESDANWQAHASALIGWIETRYGGTDNGEAGLQYGARVISEQNVYRYKMASHSSRFAAINALYAEATGDTVAKEKAYRTLNWCTYMCRSNSVVIEGPAELIANPDCWFTDGHGDYIRHFMLALGAFPEWAPRRENHLLRSSSVVQFARYTSDSISYATFDSAATEVLRLTAAPTSVWANGVELLERGDLAQPGWTFDAATGVLRIRHDATTQVQIALSAPPLNTAPVAAIMAVPPSGPAPLTVSFTAATSSDTEGDPLLYRWTFGDGGTSSAMAVSHTYASAGNYLATLVVDDGYGGLDTASVAITVAAGAGFPLTPLLDDFARANGSIGSNWTDQTTRFSIASNALVPGTGDAYIEWGMATFGANQEAFATFSTLAPGSNEHNLMLKTQGSTWSGGHIEVDYSPAAGSVRVSAFTPPSTWTTYGTIPGVTFASGDQFGARALGDGSVLVYRNGALVGSVSVAGWPFAALGGRIGVSVYNSSASRFDDFGGGNVPSSPLAVVDTPTGIELSSAFPNPTTGGIALSLALPRDEDVRMSVVDVQGREVWSSPARRHGAGRWALAWDGRTANGQAGSGLYFARVSVGSRQYLRRIAIVH